MSLKPFQWNTHYWGIQFLFFFFFYVCSDYVAIVSDISPWAWTHSDFFFPTSYEDKFVTVSFDGDPTADNELFKKLDKSTRDEHEAKVIGNSFCNFFWELIGDVSY